MQTTNPQHHIHLRKQASKKLEAYPHPVTWKRWLDRTVYVTGVLGPLMTLPQVLNVWESKSTSGVSPETWINYSVYSAIWIVYGFAHKEKPIILSNGLFFIFNALVAIGTLLSR